MWYFKDRGGQTHFVLEDDGEYRQAIKHVVGEHIEQCLEAMKSVNSTYMADYIKDNLDDLVDDLCEVVPYSIFHYKLDRLRELLKYCEHPMTDKEIEEMLKKVGEHKSIEVLTVFR